MSASRRLLAGAAGSAVGAAGLTIAFGLLVASPIYVSMYLMMRGGGSLGTLGTGGSASFGFQATYSQTNATPVDFAYTVHTSLGHRPRNKCAWARALKARFSPHLGPGSESRLQRWSFSHSQNPGALPQADNEIAPLALAPMPNAPPRRWSQRPVPTPGW